jgi:ABC-type spermidine/putrescine transport system permease subunit I
MSEGTISGIGNILENIFLTSTDFTLGAAISVILMVIMFGLNWLLKLHERKENKRGGIDE